MRGDFTVKAAENKKENSHIITDGGICIIYMYSWYS